MRARTFPTAFATLPARAPFQNLVQISSLSPPTRRLLPAPLTRAPLCCLLIRAFICSGRERFRQVQPVPRHPIRPRRHLRLHPRGGAPEAPARGRRARGHPAYAEIVFDNSDNRLPVDREEVRLRRTIGLKKDEYYLDRKHITKTEVINLLESAGFSRTNPYYCVKQGEIMKMATMHDEERLALLKEIGGTSVYEDKKRESLKVMDDTKSRRDQIQETVEFIEQRLGELDAEKDELQKYLEHDRTNAPSSTPSTRRTSAKRAPSWTRSRSAGARTSNARRRRTTARTGRTTRSKPPSESARIRNAR